MPEEIQTGTTSLAPPNNGGDLVSDVLASGELRDIYTVMALFMGVLVVMALTYLVVKRMTGRLGK